MAGDKCGTAECGILVQGPAYERVRGAATLSAEASRRRQRGLKVSHRVTHGATWWRHADCSASGVTWNTRNQGAGQGAGPAASTRRQSPRLRVDGRLQISFADARIPAVLRDLSLGGFSIETLMPVRIGDRHLFHLGPPDQPGAPLFARAAYCQPQADRGRGYISGWAAETDETSERALDLAVDHLTSGLTFE